MSLSANAQIISTFAGNGTASYTGSGSAIATGIGYPISCTFDRYGNFYFGGGGGGGYYGDRVFKVTPCGVISVVAGVAAIGYNGDGIAATAAQLNGPSGIAFDKSNNLYIADALNNRVRRVDASTGIITTIAGNGTSGFSGDGGVATAAMLYQPGDLCFDKFDNLYVTDEGNQRIRKIDTSGIISTFAGTGTGGYTGDGGLADTAEIEDLYGICTDTTGNVFFIQQYTSVVRKVNTAGIISTIAGDGTGGDSGDGGPAIDAELDPLGIALDSFGDLYITGFGENNVRQINTSGIINNVAGTGVAGYSGDGGPADSAELNYEYGIAVDPFGNIYFADVDNRRIRKVTFNPIVTPTITVTAAPSDTVCSSTGITYTATVSGAITTVTYQWIVNGSAVTGGTGSTYSYTPANGDSVRCVLSVNGICATPSSNTIDMVVEAPVAPTVAISGSDTLCAGTIATYTATPTNGGSAPTYQWYVNGSATGTGATYSYSPTGGDNLSCVLTSNALCTTTTTATSNTITVTVNALVTPAVAITVSPGDTVCGAASYTATATNGGSAPAYQWYVNGSAVATGPHYGYTPGNGDIVTCVVASNAACAAPDTAAASVTMTVADALIPSVSITSPHGDSTCAGDTMQLMAVPVNGGTAPTYLWTENGVNVATGPYYVASFINGDSVTVTMTSSYGCISPATVTSPAFVIHTYLPDTNTLVVRVSQSVSGTDTFTATASGAGATPAYQWYINGVAVAGATSAQYITDTLPSGALVSCEETSSYLCAEPNIVWSNGIGVNEEAPSISPQGGGLSVFPNPVVDVLNIVGQDIAKVTVSNVLGQVVFTTPFPLLKTGVLRVVMAPFASGVYVVEVTGGDGVRRVVKVVKE